MCIFQQSKNALSASVISICDALLRLTGCPPTSPPNASQRRSPSRTPSRRTPSRRRMVVGMERTKIKRVTCVKLKLSFKDGGLLTMEVTIGGLIGKSTLEGAGKSTLEGAGKSTLEVTIDGLIGAGKSTLLKCLKDGRYKVTPEPVQEWSLLPKYYEDNERWCFTFQVQILLSMAKAYTGGGIMERSPVSALAFIMLNKELGNLTEEEMKIYEDLHQLVFPRRARRRIRSSWMSPRNLPPAHRSAEPRRGNARRGNAHYRRIPRATQESALPSIWRL